LGTSSGKLLLGNRPCRAGKKLRLASAIQREALEGLVPKSSTIQVQSGSLVQMSFLAQTMMLP